jgi:hypothetical protein
MADLLRGVELLNLTFTASGAVVGGKFVGFDGATCAEDVKALGVCRDSVSDTQKGDAVVEGVMYVLAEENLAQGAAIATGPTGGAKPADASEIINGYNYGAAVNSGEYGYIKLV